MLVGYSTFIWWCTWEYPIEVRNMKVSDLGDYQSDYVKHFNYITDRGWKRENRMWVSSDGMKFNTVAEAYQSQKYKEMVESK